MERKELTQEQVAHIKARVAIASATVTMEEVLRENIGAAYIAKRKKSGKFDGSDSKYLENVCNRAIKEAKKATAFVERKLFAPGVYEAAYEELYATYEIHKETLWLNPEQKQKVADFIKSLRKEK